MNAKRAKHYNNIIGIKEDGDNGNDDDDDDNDEGKEVEWNAFIYIIYSFVSFDDAYRSE